MGRVLLREVVQDLEGDVQVGVSCFVYLPNTTTEASVYAAEAGGSPLSQPRTTDSEGTIAVWVDPAAYDLKVGTDAAVRYNLVDATATGEVYELFHSQVFS